MLLVEDLFFNNHSMEEVYITALGTFMPNNSISNNEMEDFFRQDQWQAKLGKIEDTEAKRYPEKILCHR